MTMGLGKTLTCLTLNQVHSLSDNDNEYILRNEEKQAWIEWRRPRLIVVSKSVLYEWTSQIDRFFGDSIRYLVFYKADMGSRYNDITTWDIGEYDIILTTYDVLSTCYRSEITSKYVYIDLDEEGKEEEEREEEGKEEEEEFVDGTDPARGPVILFKTTWRRIFTDESQRFNNNETKIYSAIMKLKSPCKWCITGTPICNYMKDLYSLLTFCGYNQLDNPKYWSEHLYRMNELQQCVFTMSYTDAGIKLPQLNVKHMTSSFSTEKEKEIYAIFKGAAQTIYRGFLTDGIQYANVLAILCRLRQCCIAPYLIMNKSKRTKPSFRSSLV